MIKMLKTAGICLLLIAALSPLNQVFAQNKQITGNVTASDTKLVAAGVTVTVKGTRTSAVTDAA